jgi:hypothetical protein
MMPAMAQKLTGRFPVSGNGNRNKISQASGFG